MENKLTGPMQNYTAFLKRKMITSRIMGMLSCFLIVACLVLMHLKLINSWMGVIGICYSMATIFSSNSFIQDIRTGNPWQRINTACAIFFYIGVVALIIYGFVAGEIGLQF